MSDSQSEDSTCARVDASILIIDDDRNIRQHLRALLGRLGVTRIAEVEDGLKGLQWIAKRETPVDLIIADLQMPRMDGIELMRHLAARRFPAPIVILSAVEPRLLRTVDKLSRMHGLRVVGVLPKPVELEALETILLQIEAGLDQEEPSVNDLIAPERPRQAPTAAELRQAIERNEFCLVYQPKVIVSNGELHSVEALVRWRHPELGIVGPAWFIELAERSGMIADISRLVFDEAAAQCHRWELTGLSVCVAVNLSVELLHDIGLPDELVALCEKHHLEPGRIMLELTETRLMADDRQTVEVLSRLRMKGFRLSIDDFGTGYASLAQLRKVPADELKIDRSFVHGAAEDETARAIQESSAALSKKFGLTLVAEGIETQADWDEIVRNECEIGQGYFISPPMRGHLLPDWVKSRLSLRPGGEHAHPPRLQRIK